jgi:hypothetical protein
VGPVYRQFVVIGLVVAIVRSNRCRDSGSDLDEACCVAVPAIREQAPKIRH